MGDIRASGSVPNHPASAADQMANPSPATTQTTHRPCSRHEVASVTPANKAEIARNHTSQEWVAAKKGRVEARIGIIRQWTAQIAGRMPAQPSATPSSGGVVDSTPSFQIVPASTFLDLCGRDTLGPTYSRIYLLPGATLPARISTS